MTDRIIFLAERIAARQAAGFEENHLFEESSDLFLVEEGLDLLASFRSITDPAMRERFRTAIDAAARGETPASVVVSKPKPVETRTITLKILRTAAVFVALLIGGSFFLEIVDPATTDVVAAAVQCAPTSTSIP